MRKTTFRQVIIRAARWLPAALALILPILFQNTIFGWLPLLFVLLAAAVSAVKCRLLRRGLKVVRPQTPFHCIRGEKLDFSVTVENVTSLFCWRAEAVFVRKTPGAPDAAATPMALVLNPHERRDFGFTVSFPHVGRYTAGLSEIRIYGLFRIIHATLRVDEIQQVEVLPQTHDFNGLPVSGSVLRESRQAYARAYAQEQDYAGVREYVPGDPIKQIHWKLSAHSNGFYTKLRESYGVPGVSVLADTALINEKAVSPADQLDCICEAAASSCRFAKERGMEYELCFADGNGQECKLIPTGAEDYAQMLEAAACAEDGSRFCTMVRNEILYLYGRANVVVVTARLTKELVQALMTAQEYRRNPILFLVYKRGGSDEHEAMLRQLSVAAIPFYTMCEPDDLEDIT